MKNRILTFAEFSQKKLEESRQSEDHPGSNSFRSYTKKRIQENVKQEDAYTYEDLSNVLSIHAPECAAVCQFSEFAQNIYEQTNFFNAAQKFVIRQFLSNGGTFNDLLETENLSNNKFVKFLYESVTDENSSLFEAYENISIEESLAFERYNTLNEKDEKDEKKEDDPDIEKAKEKNPGFWSKIKAAGKSVVDAGLATMKDLAKIAQNPVAFIKEVGKGFGDMFKEGIDFIKEAAKKVAALVLKNKEKEIEKIVSNPHKEEEKKWYDEVFTWVSKLGQKIAELITGAAAKEAKESLNHFLKVYGVEFLNESNIGYILENSLSRYIGESEDLPHPQLINTLAKEDSSFLKKYEDVVEGLSNFANQMINGAVGAAAKIIKKLGGPGELDKYPVTEGIVRIIGELVADKTIGVGLWTLDWKKLIVMAGKALANLFGSPISWITYALNGVKYLITAQHIIHTVKGHDHGDEHH